MVDSVGATTPNDATLLGTLVGDVIAALGDAGTGEDADPMLGDGLAVRSAPVFVEP